MEDGQIARRSCVELHSLALTAGGIIRIRPDPQQIRKLRGHAHGLFLHIKGEENPIRGEHSDDQQPVEQHLHEIVFVLCPSWVCQVPVALSFIASAAKAVRSRTPRNYIHMMLFSRGWRSPARTWRRHAGRASKKSIPWWASDTSPGMGT
jgi:hypothetical protein